MVKVTKKILFDNNLVDKSSFDYYYKAMKSLNTYQIKADLTAEERACLSAYAKNRGMTVQGFVGLLIRRELYSSSLSPQSVDCIPGGTV